jgi:hypothetical protein
MKAVFTNPVRFIPKPEIRVRKEMMNSEQGMMNVEGPLTIDY